MVFPILAWCYALATPPLESSDEYKHYPVVQFIANNGRLPVLDPDDPGKWLQEGAQPPLYYLLMAALTWPIDTTDLDEVHQINPHAYVGNAAQTKNKNLIMHDPAGESWPWQGTILAVYVIRIASIGLGMVSLWFIYLLGIALFSEQIGFFAVTLTALNPMFLFIHAAVNNDSLSVVWGTIGIYLLVRLWQDVPDPRKNWQHYVWLGVVCGLAILTKLSLTGILLLAGIVTALRAYQWKRPDILFVGGLRTFVISVMISGWWVGRNWMLYGDLTGLTPFIAVQGTRDNPTLWGVDWVGEWGTFYRTYWGLFGGINVIAPNPFYLICNVLFVIGMIGLIFYMWTSWQHRPLGWWLLPAWTGILFALLVRWNTISPAFQGRLIFPAIAGINVFWAYGLTYWFHWQRKDQLIWVVNGLLFLWAAVLPWYSIAPEYAYPLPTEVPTDAKFGPILFNYPDNEQIALVGVTVPPGQIITPNSPQGVEVTLYWRAETELTQDYVSSIHLLGRNVTDLDQVDRYPGWGTWPTSRWKVGQVWADKYIVFVEKADDLPTRLQISVDMLDSVATTADGTELPLVVVGEAALTTADEPEIPAVSQAEYVQFAEGITLLGYDKFPETAVLDLRLWWQATEQPAGDYTVFVQLLDSEGQYLLGADAPPVNGDYPTRWWQEGDIIDDIHTFADSADLPAGHYQIAIGLYDPISGSRLPRVDGGDAVIIPWEIK